MFWDYVFIIWALKPSMDFLDLDIQKIFSESLDNIETSVEEWIEVLKENYLSEETQEVLEDIKVLLGKNILWFS